MKELTNEDKIKLLDYIIVDLKDSIINFNPNRYCCCTILWRNLYYKLNKPYDITDTNLKAIFPEFYIYIMMIGMKLNKHWFSECQMWNIKGTTTERQMFRLKLMQYLRQKLKKQFGL